MRQVREGLFLGDITDAITVLQTPKPKITHMLSVFADELLSSHQNFAPGNLCSLCTAGASNDVAPAAPTTLTPQPGAPPLTIPTVNPTNLASRDDESGGAEVSQDPMANDDGNSNTVQSPPGGSGTEVGQDAMMNDEGNAKTVESPVGGGIEVGLDAMANDDGKPKLVESSVGGATLVSSQDVMTNDDGNAKAVESPPGEGGTEVGDGPQIINKKPEAVVVKRALVRKTVPLRDMDSENLLDHLEACLEFVEEGRTGSEGAVLVHCLAGISRSASVTTAYLMRTEKLSLIQALASLREVSPGVCPNAGFMEQLRMFEEMGCRVDKESPIYKKFQETSLAQGAECTPGKGWLSFLDNANSRGKKENSFRRLSFMNHIYNVARPIKDKAEENKISSDTPPSCTSPLRVRIARLCRRGFNTK